MLTAVFSISFLLKWGIWFKIRTLFSIVKEHHCFSIYGNKSIISELELHQTRLRAPYTRHRQTDKEVLTLLFKSQSVHQSEPSNALQFAISRSREGPQRSTRGLWASPDADAGRSCVRCTFNKRVHLTSGHFYICLLLIWDAEVSRLLPDSPEHVNRRIFLLFYAWTCYVSSTAAVQYIVANLTLCMSQCRIGIPQTTRQVILNYRYWYIVYEPVFVLFFRVYERIFCISFSNTLCLYMTMKWRSGVIERVIFPWITLQKHQVPFCFLSWHQNQEWTALLLPWFEEEKKVFVFCDTFPTFSHHAFHSPELMCICW